MKSNWGGRGRKQEATRNGIEYWEQLDLGGSCPGGWECKVGNVEEIESSHGDEATFQLSWGPGVPDVER